MPGRSIADIAARAQARSTLFSPEAADIAGIQRQIRIPARVSCPRRITTATRFDAGPEERRDIVSRGRRRSRRADLHAHDPARSYAAIAVDVFVVVPADGRDPRP